MDEQAILKRRNEAWEHCGKCAKYVGALTVEVIRHALKDNGIPVSGRDVFIRGIPIEFDLLVPRLGTPCPADEILYEPGDVIAVLEIKASGLFDHNSKKRIEDCRKEVLRANPNIFYGYVTLSERKGFHEKNFREDDWAYPLFWYKQLNGQQPYESTELWEKLLSELRKRINTK